MYHGELSCKLRLTGNRDKAWTLLPHSYKSSCLGYFSREPLSFWACSWSQRCILQRLERKTLRVIFKNKEVSRREREMGKDPEVERNSKGKRSITRIGKEERDKDNSGVYFPGLKSEYSYRLKETQKKGKEIGNWCKMCWFSFIFLLYPCASPENTFARGIDRKVRFQGVAEMSSVLVPLRDEGCGGFRRVEVLWALITWVDAGDCGFFQDSVLQHSLLPSVLQAHRTSFPSNVGMCCPPSSPYHIPGSFAYSLRTQNSGEKHLTRGGGLLQPTSLAILIFHEHWAHLGY